MLKQLLFPVVAILLASGFSHAAVVGGAVVGTDSVRQPAPAVSGGSLLLGGPAPEPVVAGKFNPKVVGAATGALTLSRSSTVGLDAGVPGFGMPGFASGLTATAAGAADGFARPSGAIHPGGLGAAESGRDSGVSASAQWDPVMFYSESVAGAFEASKDSSSKKGGFSLPGILAILGAAGLAGFVGFRKRQKVGELIGQFQAWVHKLHANEIATPTGAPIHPHFLNVQHMDYDELPGNPPTSKPSKPADQNQ